jgi:hypothetical protein
MRFARRSRPLAIVMAVVVVTNGAFAFQIVGGTGPPAISGSRLKLPASSPTGTADHPPKPDSIQRIAPAL